jgi:flagellar motor switch protein FliG
MAVTNVSQSNTFDQWRVKTNTIATDLGDAATLNTTATTAVGGVNELNNNVGQPANLTTTAKSNVVSGVNELNTNIGQPANLNTTAKSNVVASVNEVNTKIGSLNNLTTTDQTDLVSAVNETKNFSLAIAIALG